MTDPHRDPTRTEDVEEALEALDELHGITSVERAKGITSTVRSTIRDLRELLEETQADLHHTKRKMVDPEEMHRARRRADRLEEAVRLVLKWFSRFGYEEGGPKMDSQDVIGTLRSALDSREDEGEERAEAYGSGCWHCPNCGVKNPSSAGERCMNCGMLTGPVHADEPEGDELYESEHISSGGDDGLQDINGRSKMVDNLDTENPERMSDDWLAGVLEVRGQHARTEAHRICVREAARRLRGRPTFTDEPVSGEGEGSEIVDAALNHCAECLSFRPDDYDAGDDLDRVLTRVRHLRDEYGDEEAESGGWATRYQQDVCALLNLLHDRPTHADARSEGDALAEKLEARAEYVEKAGQGAAADTMRAAADQLRRSPTSIDWSTIGVDYSQAQVEADGYDFASWEQGFEDAVKAIRRRLSDRHEDEGDEGS